MVKPASLHVLPDKQAYQQVFAGNTCKSGNSSFLLLAKLSADQSVYSRLGMVVSRKNVRKACHRNKIKRVVKETFRHKVNLAEFSYFQQYCSLQDGSLQINPLSIQPGQTEDHQSCICRPFKAFDYVFLARPSIIELDKKQLASLFSKVWTRLICRI